MKTKLTQAQADVRLITIKAVNLSGEKIILLDTGAGIVYTKALIHLGQYRDIQITINDTTQMTEPAECPDYMKNLRMKILSMLEDAEEQRELAKKICNKVEQAEIKGEIVAYQNVIEVIHDYTRKV